MTFEVYATQMPREKLPHAESYRKWIEFYWR